MAKKPKFEPLYQALLADVRTLKLDLESMAHHSKHTAKDAFFDAADMTKRVLESDESRQATV